MCLAKDSFQKVLGKRLNHSQGKKPSKLTGITVSVVQCKNCGLIFSNPQPVPEKMSDHYGTPPETYWTEDYFKVNPDYWNFELIRLRKLMTIKPGMKALDIGAGIGKCMIALNNAGFDAYGFEPSVPFYERALDKMNIDKDKLKLDSIESAEYAEKFFDFISFGAVLEHLYDPDYSIKKALSWLKPGGIIQIEVPSSNWLINRLGNFYYRLSCTDYVANISPMHNPFHLYEFSLKSFQEHAKRNNYEIALHEYYVGLTYMPKIIDKFLFKIMEQTETGMQLCVWLKKK
jgi:2-polyprenyl-3-methyl-5-hydroxy-6-metoxy-1,4-benzoquinol methylase